MGVVMKNANGACLLPEGLLVAFSLHRPVRISVLSVTFLSRLHISLSSCIFCSNPYQFVHPLPATFSIPVPWFSSFLLPVYLPSVHLPVHMLLALQGLT